jgi:hypothetical protein
VHWIDEEVKAETLKAMREGVEFPEVDLVFEGNLKEAGQ